MKIIVVGSGIVGASAAYQLVRNHHEVVLIDRKNDGAATAAGAGIVCPWVSSGRGENWYRIAKEGALFYPTLVEQLKEDGEDAVGYKKVGALCVSSDSEQLHTIEEEVREKYKTAPEIGDIQRLTAAEARELFPPLNEELEAVFISGAARVDGRLLRDAMVRASKKRGATIIQGKATLIRKEDTIIGVTCQNETIYADKVLIAAGAWVPELLAPHGVDIKVEPQRGQIAHIDMHGADTSNWPVVLPQTSHYMLAFDDSRVVAGATREDGSGFDYQTTVGGVHEVLSHALDVAPGLANGTVQEVRIGFRPMGPDFLPLLGELEQIKGVVIATGLGASGLTMGPFVGSIAASIAQDEKVDMDLSPYYPERGNNVGNASGN
ncbi:FAD-dependent oxidoreductase [Virgibacillus sp. 179-BFC.A HS]|uniref:FAD-dependent oxidoreductase n=1 Tax=Tigheibacillus jepli TaxID=3035914 RepID=A0ABU5CJP9_9BACI|nr:FAD-dependent oxidoreductase [Virgibacillus sp. 179-BFC.A HS]MDY0406530.1 FAD-dependent oxidoreductase [Virgibacillus sp. 179-BFC.A HS]